MKRLILVSTLALSMSASAVREGSSTGNIAETAERLSDLANTLDQCANASGRLEGRCRALFKLAKSSVTRIKKGWDLFSNPDQCSDNPDLFLRITRGYIDSPSEIGKRVAVMKCVKKFSASLDKNGPEISAFLERAGDEGKRLLEDAISYIETPVDDHTDMHTKLASLLKDTMFFNLETNKYDFKMNKETGERSLIERVKEASPRAVH